MFLFRFLHRHHFQVNVFEHKIGQPYSKYLIYKMSINCFKLGCSFFKYKSIVSDFNVSAFLYQLVSVSVLSFLSFCCQIFYSWLALYTTHVDISSTHHKNTTHTLKTCWIMSQIGKGNMSLLKCKTSMTFEIL